MATNPSPFGGIQNDPRNLLTKPLIPTYDAQGFSNAPQVDARNDQGQMVTNAMKVGGASAARRQPLTPTGLIGAAAPAPATAASNVGGVQNTPAPAAAPVAAPVPAAVPGASGALGNAATMQQHWNQYWENFGPGTAVPFAGGTLTRNQDGTATFKNAGGQSYTYNQSTPFAAVAAAAPEIAAQWQKDFGYGANQAGTAPATGANPGAQQTEVTPAMTVEERAAAIAATDSPLMQQARGRAMQQMNERGLINSSIGVQAGQDAVLDRATDIAKADAQTEFQNSQNNANRSQQLQIAQLQAQTSLQNAKLSAETQMSVAEINRQYSQMAGLSSSANSLLSSFNNDVNAITLSDLTPEAKEAAINQRAQTLRMSMGVMGSINGDVDLMTLLDQILG